MENGRHEHLSILDAIGPGSQNEHGNRISTEVLLVDHIAIHRNQDIKPAFHGLSEQCSILNSTPTEQWNRFHLVPGQIALQAPVEIFVQENAYSGRRKRMLLGFLEQRDDLIPRDAWKSIKEILD
jgi:hypothetical protein